MAVLRHVVRPCPEAEAGARVDGLALPLVFLAACGGASIGVEPSVRTPPMLALSTFASGYAAPLALETPEDGTGRMFVVEQGGTLRIVRGGSVVPAPYLDVSALVESGAEKGLLGLAFHPAYAANRRFFVHYTRRTGGQLQSVIAEYRASAADPDRADPASARELLVVNQPFDNHNGGQLAFGPDGYFYVGLGDGGSAGDPQGNAQNRFTLLGKILRMDVDGAPAPGKAYAIPPDNPFAAGGGLPEIYALGLRNPYRYAFDRPTGRLFVADVGQNRYEEVSLVTRGANLGWNIVEGLECFPADPCNRVGLTPPIAAYAHDASGGTSVIGGYVYRGAAVPRLAGAYVFGDLTGGKVWALVERPQGTWEMNVVLTHALTVSAFGRDSAGELYVVDYGNGAVLRLVAAP